MRVQLTAGRAACDGVARLLQRAEGDVVGMAIEPNAGRHRACELLALFYGEESIVIDVAQSPGLGELLASSGPFAAVDGKRHAHALFRAYEQVPARFADPIIAQQLLQGGRLFDYTPTAIARAHNVAAPPDLHSGIEGLASFARFAHTLISAQGAALNRAHMGSVSRIEAHATVPLARIERHGLPFREEKWRAVVADARAQQCLAARQIAEEIGARAALPEASKSPNGPEEAWLLAALQTHFSGVKGVDASSLTPLPPSLRAQVDTFLGGLRRLRASGARFAEHAGADGRIAATFEQIGASTGRMSCTSPNLQGVPNDTARRACFAPDEGRLLVMGDYQACELRILAAMSGDPSLSSAFLEGQDVHTRVAQEIFGHALQKEGLAQARQRAKALSFGLIYGMSAAGLAQQVNCSKTEANALIAAFFRTFPKVQQFLVDGAEAAIRRGFATSISGRRLYLPSAGEGDPQDHARLVRLARNMPIQASSADITKAALGALEQIARQKPEMWVVHCVHDEIVLEVPAEAAPELAGTLRKTMSAAARPLVSTIPMTVDVAARKHWGHSD